VTSCERLVTAPSHDGRLLRLTLAAGKGNVIDRALARELNRVLDTRTGGSRLRAVLLAAEGPHFSFGASVPEHAPELAEGLLLELHGVVRRLLALDVPVIAAVRGACLGGGLELVLPARRIVARPQARLGLPEVTLAMFAPAGSALLPLRVSHGVAQEMLVTGRVLSGEEAHRHGLVDELAEDPEDAAVRWIEERLLPLSATAVRLATRAASVHFRCRTDGLLEDLERSFLEDVMTTDDAQEGVRAFLEKRPPVWVDA